MPVAGETDETLLFPRWTPGDHAPNGPIDRLAGLVVTADGRPLPWRRDPLALDAFHVAVPANVRSIDVSYQFLESFDARRGPRLMTRTMLDLQWPDVVLYPAGYFARDVPVAASLTLPHGWSAAGAPDATRAGDAVRFAPVTLDTLLDSPEMAGSSVRRLPVATTPADVRLDVASEGPSTPAVPAASIAALEAVVTQAGRLFGARHYDHYDFLLWLSDDFGPAYYEHHRSGENDAPAALFADATPPDLSFLVHGYAHSWNGMFRRPADMWTATPNEPERESLFRVFEVLTDFCHHVLSARAGLESRPEVLDDLAGLDAVESTRPGLAWRPLRDVDDDPILKGRRPEPWRDWQLGMFDAYQEGELIWLDVDAMIRERTHDTKLLDKFAHAFYDENDGSFADDTYTFDDLVHALNDVTPYDWAAFLNARLDATGDGATLLDGLTREGYRIAYDDTPPAPSSRGLDLSRSIGAVLSREGRVTTVAYGGPADDAGLTTEDTLATVDGRPFAAAMLTDAIVAAERTGSLRLGVTGAAGARIVALHWRGGLRTPHLARIDGTPDRLDELLAPRTRAPPAQARRAGPRMPRA